MKHLITLFLLSLSLSVNAAFVVTSTTKTNVAASNVTSGLISASGYGYSPYTPRMAVTPTPGQNSYFQVKFDIVGDQYVSLDSSLSSVALNGQGDIWIQSGLSLINNASNEYLLGAVAQSQSSSLGGDWWVTDYVSNGTLNIKRDFFLSQGSYTLTAGAYGAQSSSGYGQGRSTYDFTLTAVPLPAAAWLFGSAIVGLFGFTRRKHLGQ